MERTQALTGGPLLVVVGEALLVVCSACYLVWWTITFKPSGRGAHGGPFLGGAVLAGLGGIVLLAVGIVALAARASWLAPAATVLGGVLVGALLLYVTSILAHRPVTTELPLIVLWGTAQAAAGVALRTSGVLETPATMTWFVALVVATVVGLACYLVFYSLDPVSAYRVGMVPLAVDGVVAIVLAALVAFVRSS